MAEKEEEPQPKINYIEMTHICGDCSEKENCEVACMNGVCKILPKP